MSPRRTTPELIDSTWNENSDDESEKSASSCADGAAGSTSTAADSTLGQTTREVLLPSKFSALPFSRTEREDYTQHDDLEQATTDTTAKEIQQTTEVRSEVSEVTNLLAGGLAYLGGEYAWMICCVQTGYSSDGSFVTSILPCTNHEAVVAVQAAGEAVEMWCWLQPDGQGSMFAVPCNDRPLHLIETPPSAAEQECAPPPPAVGSYKPQWMPEQWGHICSPPTTLVLSNLPTSLAQEDFLELLDRADFSGYYDFVFLEADLVTGRSNGIALVNCTRYVYALAMAAKFHGRTSWPTSDEDSAALSCEVQWSSICLQGRDSLIEQYRDHPLNKTTVPEEMRPQLFKDGWPSPITTNQF
jgi:hypothetical protein